MQIMDSIIDGIYTLPDTQMRNDAIVTVTNYLYTGKIDDDIDPVVKAMIISWLPVLGESRNKSLAGKRGGKSVKKQPVQKRNSASEAKTAKSEKCLEDKAEQNEVLLTEAQADKNTDVLTEAETVQDTVLLTEAETVQDTVLLTEAETVQDTVLLTEAETAKSEKCLPKQKHQNVQSCLGNGREGNGRELKETLSNESVKKNSRFSPPTPEEVREYANSRNISIDSEHFCDVYAAKGWKVGTSPMKDWRAAVRNWARRELANNSPKQQQNDAFSRFDVVPDEVI